MFLSSKGSDKKLQKDSLFDSLYSECKKLSPAALLPYKLRNRLEKYTPSERKDLVNRLKYGCAPLFVVCHKGNLEVVEYLLTFCKADIEQKGVYEVGEDRSVHTVTPLWCAAVKGNVDVVKCLIDHGANINSVSDTGSTPVRSACFMTNLDIVRYLVEKGADINKANYNGGTCLINSVQSVSLCEYLINNGCDVNAQDIQNKTALHYAIQEHRYETTKFLIENNANPRLKSKNCDDALQTSCLKGAYNIFKYLIDTVKYPMERIAEGYELLGSTFLDEHHDIHLALDYWRKAVTIREDNDLPKNIEPPCKAFEYVKEFSNRVEMEFVAMDHDSIRIHSLLICKRILGPTHKDTIFRLMYRGAAFGDSLQYQRCINLWLYALELKIIKDTIIYADTTFTAQTLIKLYLDMMYKYSMNEINYTIKFEDAYHSLKVIANEIPGFMKHLNTRPVHTKHINSFDMILKVFVHMIYICLNISLNDAQLHSVAMVTNKIIYLDPKTSNNYSLLHLSLMRNNIVYDNSLYVDVEKTPFPCLEVTQFLLKCGADPTAMASDMHLSPLHISAYHENFNVNIIRTLLKYGAHIDQASKSGNSALSLLSSNPDCNIDLMQHTTLKCLASRAIQRNCILFVGHIPVHLEKFVRMH